VARIFYGRRDMLSDAVLEAVKTLDDDFWVLAEFDLDHRNIDWLIIRAVPDDLPEGHFSTLYLTELKQTSAQLSGGENGRWTAERNGITTEVVPSNKADENHWHQAINVANVVRGWLYTNQRRYLSLSRPGYGEAAFKLWPILLILSNPPGIAHRLPLKPANRFGAFHFDLELWLDTLKHWEVRQGIQLTARDLGRLVDAIGLQELTQPAESAKLVEASGDLTWLQGFARWAKGIEDRLSRLEDLFHVQQAIGAVAIGLEKRLEFMERELKVLSEKPAKPITKSKKPSIKPGNNDTAATKPAAKPAKAAIDPAQRALNEEEKRYFATALTKLRAGNKSRTVSMLCYEMNRLMGGETLKQRKYNGYGSVRALLDRAKEEEIIRYGPVDGTGMPTIYAYNETIPK